MITLWTLRSRCIRRREDLTPKRSCPTLNYNGNSQRLTCLNLPHEKTPMLFPFHSYVRSTVGCLLAVLLFVSHLSAAEAKIFTQRPEIAPAEVRGEAGQSQEKGKRPPEELLKNGPKPLW